MKRTALAIAAVAATLVTATGCSQAASAPLPPPSAPLPSHTSVAVATPGAAAQRRLVFFMNPNGRPCQMQDQILRGMAAELQARASVVYVKTTEPADLVRFEQYGIRSLPALVLTDGAGAEVRRATPGIQDEAAIRALLGP